MKYIVTVTAAFEYDTDEVDWITSGEDAIQDTIDFLVAEPGLDHFDFDVTTSP